MTPGARCPVCGQQLPGRDRLRGGRKLRYCSAACKAKAYRARQHSGERASAAEPALPSTAAARHARVTGIRQQISELTAALADAATVRVPAHRAPHAPRRYRGSPAPAHHRTRGARHSRDRASTPDDPPRGSRHPADSAPVPGTGHARGMSYTGRSTSQAQRMS